MKEFIIKHPIITFLLADTLICGVVNLGTNIARAFASKGRSTEAPVQEKTEEDDANEPSGDI